MYIDGDMNKQLVFKEYDCLMKNLMKRPKPLIPIKMGMFKLMP